MDTTKRRQFRFADFGHVEIHELCAINGILVNISLSGCKIHFPLNITVDLERDYRIKITTSRKGFKSPFVLLCHPQWCENVSGGTNIGFTVLRSPDTTQWAVYINQIKKENNSFDGDMIKDIRCQFL